MVAKRYSHRKRFIASADDEDCKHYCYTLEIRLKQCLKLNIT